MTTFGQRVCEKTIVTLLFNGTLFTLEHCVYGKKYVQPSALSRQSLLFISLNFLYAVLYEAPQTIQL